MFIGKSSNRKLIFFLNFVLEKFVVLKFKFCVNLCNRHLYLIFLSLYFIFNLNFIIFNLVFKAIK